MRLDSGLSNSLWVWDIYSFVISCFPLPLPWPYRPILPLNRIRKYVSHFHDNFCWIMDKQGGRIIACRIVSSTCNLNLYAITSFEISLPRLSHDTDAPQNVQIPVELLVLYSRPGFAITVLPHSASPATRSTKQRQKEAVFTCGH
jgi:hypothetical protein